MDSTTNSSSMSNSTPNPVPEPLAGPAPEPLANQGAGVGVAQVAGQSAGATPTPVQGVAAGAIPDMPTPVNPIAQPSNPGPVDQVADPMASTAMGAAMNPAMMATPRFEGIAATDPIMKPDPLPEPDPVEEELKAPMKAAGPVPGSIGSAVSGSNGTPETNPFGNGQGGAMMPNVGAETNAANVGAGMNTASAGAGMGANMNMAVNVGANAGMSQQNNMATMPNGATQPKKKNNKTTLIILIAVAAVVVVVLVVVLIMQVTGGSKTAMTPVSSTPIVAVEEEEEEIEEEEEQEIGTLSCARGMNEEELTQYDGAIAGTIKIDAEYDESANLETLTVSKVTEYASDAEEEVLPSNVEILQTVAEEINVDNNSEYYLGLNVEGEPYKTQSEMLANYEELDFACEML